MKDPALSTHIDSSPLGERIVLVSHGKAGPQTTCRQLSIMASSPFHASTTPGVDHAAEARRTAPPGPYDPFTSLYDTLIDSAEREEVRRATLTTGERAADGRVWNAEFRQDPRRLPSYGRSAPYSFPSSIAA
jgi:hypothetical protein